MGVFKGKTSLVGNIESPSVNEFGEEGVESSQNNSGNTSVESIVLGNLEPFTSVFIVPLAGGTNNSLSGEGLGVC